MRELSEIQRRFYDLVTSEEGAVGQSDTARELFGSERNAEVYARMYVGRLHDTLAEDFPKLRLAIGEASFQQLASQYVRARPPTSFTIRDAGVALSEYLSTRNDLPEWCADLAALERSFIDVFHGPEVTPLTRETLAAVPPEAFPEFELQLVPASVVLPIRWTVDDLWGAIDANQEVRSVRERCMRTVVVWRRDLRILHRTLDSDEADLISRLVRPTSIATLSEALAERCGDAPEQRMVQLLACWLDAQLVAG